MRLRGEPRALERAVALDRLARVIGAARMKPAVRAQQRPKQVLVAADQRRAASSFMAIRARRTEPPSMRRALGGARGRTPRGQRAALDAQRSRRSGSIAGRAVDEARREAAGARGCDRRPGEALGGRSRSRRARHRAAAGHRDELQEAPVAAPAGAKDRLERAVRPEPVGAAATRCRWRSGSRPGR